MATYYIDFVGGNDASAGTKLAPWKTLPGTLKANPVSSSDWQSTDWGSGTINASHPVPPGTNFLLKPGGIGHTSANGGFINIYSTFYQDASLANPILIQPDPTWAAGAVVFDGTGMITNGVPGLITPRMNGVKIDGIVSGGIIVRYSYLSGIQVKEKGSGAAIADTVIQHVKFIGNGTSYGPDPNEGSGDGQLEVRNADGLTLLDLEFDGNGQHINGCLLGESHMAVINATVTDCIAYGHMGDDPPNDCGIGFKAQNSIITYKNVRSHNNLKGFDCGEDHGDGVQITYKMINCQAYSNTYGLDVTGAIGGPQTTTFYLINCIIRDNTGSSGSATGSKIYAGPYKLYMVHCVYSNNGDSSGYEGDVGNLLIEPDNPDTSHIEAYLYNNIFYKPYGIGCNFNNNYFNRSVTDFSLYSDYNCWRQNGSQDFSVWDSNNLSGQVVFTYAQGPGSSSSDWYLWYDYQGSTAPTTGCNGHYHSDAHSVTTEPPFSNVGAKDYTLTTHMPGTDLSVKTWYIAEMGLDANGVTRTSWDMGSFEFGSSPAKKVMLLK